MNHKASHRNKRQRQVKKQKENRATRIEPTLLCPLCNQPITDDDRKGNVHKLEVNNKPVPVHRECPGE